MAASDLSVLLDMGFEEERAQIAVKKTGGCKSSSPQEVCQIFKSPANLLIVQGALQWLEDNQDKPLDEIKAPETKPKNDEEDPNVLPPNLLDGEVAKSLVCDDCGKKFRSEAQAEYHATKT
jgi:hypothetical protein